MKTGFLLLLTFVSLTARLIAVDTNLSQTITLERPLEDVVRAMQVYYHDASYHGHAYAATATNAVDGVSYTLTIGDCAFHRRIGAIMADVVGTRIATNSTRLEFLVKSEFGFPKESDAAKDIKQEIFRTLQRIAKIAETKG